jgi:hypothetical protein
VRVVAHSLGSIVALSALEGGRASAPGVDLTTMGCPLMLLAERLPRAYGRARPDHGRRTLAGVARWRNFYFSQDVIGRGLAEDVCLPGPDSTKFEPSLALGEGTHTDYFPDRRFGSAFLGYGAGAGAGLEAAGGGQSQGRKRQKMM